MRLRRLLLARYGHLTDQEIAFPDTPDLHIVVGANEAGKSTALSAIGDALFRFPHRTPYDFLHKGMLSVGVEVQALNGTHAVFFRRKGKPGNDLMDGDGQIVQESAITAFLGGATRERFDTVFGLNGTELRAGGRAILDGHGDAGSAIMGAYTGVHNFRKLADRLQADAGRLFGDRKGNRTFYDALGRYQDARKDANERRIDPEAWKTTSAERDRLEQAQRDNEVRLAELHVERTRLDRTRRTTPFRLRLLARTAERDTLGPAPDLPDDAARQFAAAVAARDQAARDLQRLRHDAGERDAALAVLPADDPVLATAKPIDALVSSWELIAKATTDREAQRLIAAQHAAAMAGEGAQLGLTLEADALAAKRPSALVRQQVLEALGRHDTLQDRRNTAAERMADADEKRQAAQARLDAMPDLEPPTALRDAIERVREEGKLDAALADAEKTLEAARAECEQALAMLPLWTGDADALAAMRPPLTAQIDRASAMLDQRQRTLQEKTAELARLDQDLAALAAQAQADAATGEVPTPAAIHAARHRRDQAWALIRRSQLDGGAAITDAEREACGLGPDSAAGFEALIRAADTLADRRAQEQARVVTAEQRLRRQVELQALREGAAAACAEAADQVAQGEAAWRALWQESGLDASAPAAMKEWLTRREIVLSRHKAAVTAARDHDALRVRHDAALTALVAVADALTLAARLKAADVLCKAQEAQVAARETARLDLERASADHRKALQAAEKIDADLAAWQTGWAATASALALPPETPPSMARAALQHWQRIDEAARERQATQDRVDQMTAAIDRYAADTAAIAARVATDLSDEPPLDTVRTLADRLSTARRTHEARERLNQERRKGHAEIDRQTQTHAASAAVLDALRGRVHAADEAGLLTAIERAQRLRSLRDEVVQMEADLRKQDDGKTLAELAAEAEGLDVDAIPARLATIESELAALDAAHKAELEMLLRVRNRVAEMEQGRDAAASAQAMETALADIDDVVVRYPPVRMAQVLLRAGIERFRRQQQGPLLARASQIFARLTEGRYDRLEVDETEDGTPYVSARRPDGVECRADRLSEGTLDQLYLALRLAAIETEAQTTEPLPFIGDDLLVNFDDNRARAALRVLSDFSRVTQVILFTHHDHIAGMAEAGLASVHRMRAVVSSVSA